MVLCYSNSSVFLSQILNLPSGIRHKKILRSKDWRCLFWRIWACANPWGGILYPKMTPFCASYSGFVWRNWVIFLLFCLFYRWRYGLWRCFIPPLKQIKFVKKKGFSTFLFILSMARETFSLSQALSMMIWTFESDCQHR